MAKRFSLAPGSRVLAVELVTQAWTPYQLSQSGLNCITVATTMTPKKIRNNAIGMGDCSAKKNSFHASAQRRNITSGPPTSRHTQGAHVDPKAGTQTNHWNPEQRVTSCKRGQPASLDFRACSGCGRCVLRRP